jgi:hypothetical protein
MAVVRRWGNLLMSLRGSERWGLGLAKPGLLRFLLLFFSLPPRPSFLCFMRLGRKLPPARQEEFV